MPDDCEEFISLTLRTKDSKKPLGMPIRKLETSMAPAMPCKTCKKSKKGEIRDKTNEINSKLVCILEASESTRLRMEDSLPNCHEDHIAGKVTALQFGSQIYSYASSHQNSSSKSSSGQRMGKLEKILA